MPSATLDTLRRRADLIERTRDFFRSRGVLEVDTPVLQGGANLDHGVVPMRCEDRFLPTSPEHPLKRLVASGSGAVWTLAPAFRRGELGKRHGPEFRMLEWYRPGWDDQAIAAETVDLLEALSGLRGGSERVSWREAFRQHAGCDPRTASDADLRERLGIDADAAGGDREIALDLLLTRDVEPHLGRGRWTLLVDYPASGAAQARLRRDAEGELVAARFEVYRDGVELANGYWELTDAAELDARLEGERAGRGDPTVRRDQRFAAAMSAGLGDCAGVAVGFDRVVMLALGLGSVAETQAFAWDRA
ncbi:MAG: EF-P lysine aminoacylase GenX [Planctomycetes bacterium]|nr:EF-P lysine aminoacylase GenX [Planctomycetota bacterium]